MNLVLGEHFGWLHSARVCGCEIQHVGGLSGVLMHAAWGVLCAWCLWIIGTNIYLPEEKSWVYVYGSDPVQTVLCQLSGLLCLCGREVHPASWGLSFCPARWHSWGQCVTVPSAAHWFALCSDWWITNDKTEDLVSFLLYSSVGRNLSQWGRENQVWGTM